METINKSLTIIHHFGHENADFYYNQDGILIWNGPGEKPTQEQLEQWEQERISAVALRDQRSSCIKLLDESECKVSDDPPYPEDVAAWKTVRAQWRTILKSDKIQEIPPKPFS